MNGKRFAFLILFYCICCSLFSCKNYNRNKTYSGVVAESIEQGDALAHQYCKSCHMFPEPSTLNAITWDKGVLPMMGPMLGIFSHNFQRYPSGRKDRNLESNFYPANPQLSSMQWQHVIDYYTATSPDSLSPPIRQYPVKTGLPFFNVQLLQDLPLKTVTYLKILSPAQQLIIGDQETQSLVLLNKNFEVTDSLPVAGTIVDINFTGGIMMLCDIGQLNPTNGKFGQVRSFFFDSSGNEKLDTVPVLKGLARPVQINTADIDQDGKTDWLVCEFGFLQGNLSWYRNMGNDSFQRQVVRPVPGASRLYIRDDNNDGLPDLWVLFAQGDEGIYHFINKGKGEFEEQQVLQFPPVYGSTSFELADFNQDGFQDIIYTCGDNADYSRILKPYHGVYIFLNDGENHFRQQYFYPLNGCFKAVARDFDQDGDLDIAAISFFADYAMQPEEAFVFLENDGNFDFQPYSFTESKHGRWLTMDAGDFDGDGKIDLVLGNFSEGPVVSPSSIDWKKGPGLIVLRNISGQ